MTEAIKDGLKIGWAQCNITPDESVYLAGQHYARISEGVMDPVTSTALAIESVRENQPVGEVVMVSCDLVSISDELRDAVRKQVKAEVPQLGPENIFLSATHTHSAPLAGFKKRYLPENKNKKKEPHPYGAELNAMDPEKYVDWAGKQIAKAVNEAWQKRKPGGIGYGLGHAVVARNRRLTYGDGTSKMYGDPRDPEFSYVEGYEDHSIYLMTTYDESRSLTGMVVNVPCPSQVSEHDFQVSADYWHDTRRELRKRFGDDINILAQCAPAGDLSPHVLVGKRAEERMWRLKGRNTDQNAPRREIAEKISNAVSNILPCAEKEIDWNPNLSHQSEVVELPRRKLTQKDIDEISGEYEDYKKEYETRLEEIENNPEKRKEKRWYKSLTNPYKKMKWLENVQRRLELQEEHPDIPLELHAVRIGEIAFATSPFELYLDYGIRMRELSEATQTFLVQLAGPGSYLPSERSVAHKGYGSVPASTDIGPEGGEKLVEWTVNTLNQMMKKKS